MKITFLIPEDCEVIQNGNTVTIVSKEQEVRVPMLIETPKLMEAKGRASTYYLHSREKFDKYNGFEIKAGLK